MRKVQLPFLILLVAASFELFSFSANAQIPTLSLPISNIEVCQGATSGLIPYKTENNPDQYTIVYIDKIFTDIPQWTPLPPSPLTIDIPNGASLKSYKGIIMVRNSSTRLVSKEIAFNITMVPGIFPAFDPIGPFPSNSPTQILPSVSQNGIYGKWKLFSKNMQLDGITNCIYVFTPFNGQCAQSTKVIITILPPVSEAIAITKVEKDKPNNRDLLVNQNKLEAKPSFTTIAYIGSPFCMIADPVQCALNGQSGGKFSAKKGLSINPWTGVINPASSKPGSYLVTYRIKSSSVIDGFSITTPVTILTPPEKPFIKFKDSVLQSSSINDNQWCNSLGPIDGATSQFLQVDFDDKYYVVVNQDNCMSEPSEEVNYVADRDGMNRKRVRLGFSIGANTRGFRIKSLDIYKTTQTPNPGININLIADYQLGRTMNIRVLPGILFNQWGLKITETSSMEKEYLGINSTSFELPVALNFHLPRRNNHRPYLTTGITPSFDLLKCELSKGIISTVDVFDLYLDIGLGFQNFRKQSCTSTELKVSFGMVNLAKALIKQDDNSFFYSGINQLFPNLFTLSFQL